MGHWLLTQALEEIKGNADARSQGVYWGDGGQQNWKPNKTGAFVLLPIWILGLSVRVSGSVASDSFGTPWTVGR